MLTREELARAGLALLDAIRDHDSNGSGRSLARLRDAKSALFRACDEILTTDLLPLGGSTN